MKPVLNDTRRHPTINNMHMAAVRTSEARK
jgi:hypothetical protein